MGKWLKRIAIALGGLAAFLFLAVYFGGRYAAERYLAREWKAGPGRVRLYAPVFRWSLDLAADSALYLSPRADVRVAGLRLSADLFRSLTRIAPSARVDIDTVWVRVRPGPDAAKPLPDSLPFPDLKLPAAARIRVGQVIVRDTAPDREAPLVAASDVALETRGARAAALTVASLRARATRDLPQRASASVDWGGSEVAAALDWGRGKDSARVEARLAKANLMRASATARARIASSRPYASALGLKASWPRAEGVALDARLGHQDGFTASLRLDLKATGLPKGPPLAVEDQALSFRFDFDRRRGTWSLRARGKAGTEADLQGRVAVAGADSLGDPAFLARHAEATLRGRVRGFRALVGGKDLPADLDIADAAFSHATARASVATGDGSRLTADLRRVAVGVPRRSLSQGNGKVTPAPLPGWGGTFAIDLAPREAWLRAFTDTNVEFSRARLAGEIRGGAVTAELEARDLKAYGALADSVRAYPRWERGVAALAPSRLWREGTAWEVTARAEPGRAGPPASVRLANPECGSIEAARTGPGRMEARLRGLALDRLPYRGLGALKDHRPRLTADFAWDRIARTGSLDLAAQGRYQKETADLALRAAWDAERLEVSGARAALAGNGIAASARVRLHGRQFYDLRGLEAGDVEDVSVRADRFDLAKALAAVLPRPPLRSGRVSGDLAFSAGQGFRGDWRLLDLSLPAEERRFSVREASLAGKGDTLVLRAVTASETEPLFRDSAMVAVTGILDGSQGIVARVRAGPRIELDFDGSLAGFRDLKGSLSARGGAELPGGSGALSDVRVRAEVSVPLREGLRGLQVSADTLRGTYAVAGLDTQDIDAAIRMRGGKIEIPRLSLKGRDGAELRGHAEYEPGSRALAAELAGERLSLQFGGDKFQLRGLSAQVRMDSAQFIAQLAVGSGSAEYVKAALRAVGDFSRLSAYYRRPLRARAQAAQGGSLPLLRLSATLDTSHVRYRLRNSLEGLLGVFSKQKGQRRATGRRANPMQVQINLETAGRANTVETDVVRVAYVGNLSMVGTYPYALLRGRLNSVAGGIGSKRQAYDIKSMEIKWLNAPLEEGQLDLHAEKRLARTCDPGAVDSCAIRMNLTGTLAEVKFAYDSDCRGGFGSGGADVTALLFSVRRGCYSPSSSTSADGLTYQEQALGLLDPFASSYLSEGLSRISGRWIQSAQVSGIGALAQDRKGAPTDTTREAIGVEILSKEFWRVRLRAKSAYNLQYADQFNPWSYRVGLEWQPPLFRLVEDPAWRSRIKNKITVDASVFTDPSHSVQDENEDPLRRRVGLNYSYDWWGHWWARPGAAGAAERAATPAGVPAREAGAVPDPSR